MKGNTSHFADTNVMLPDKIAFASFENNTVSLTWSAPKDGQLSFSMADDSKTFKCINLCKAASPGGILRACADQLAGVFTDIFNLSLSQSAVPTCFNMSTIVPVPNKSKVTELNDYRPLPFTCVMKCFERLVNLHRIGVSPADG
jgi:hypothetical protein